MVAQGGVEDRRCVRVKPPSGLLLEAALWVRPRREPTRLHLRELGAPELRFAAGGGGLPERLRLDDVSANGLLLELEHAADLRGADVVEKLLALDCEVFLYLKLAQPHAEEGHAPLCLMLCAEPVLCRRRGEGLELALTIRHRGQPDRDDKSLTFFFVARHPIRELAAWCDEVALMDRPRVALRSPGLHMDRLLAELDEVLAVPGAEQS